MKYTMHVVLIALSLWIAEVCADWPTYMGDNSRSGVSADPVELTDKPAWVFEAAHPPSAGFYHQIMEKTIGPQRLKAQANTYDFAFAPVIAGGKLYFGSSTEESLSCLDAKTGELKWTVYTEGAIRLAATVFKGRVYFGSDDGFVYCLNAETGTLIWKFNAAPGKRRVIANGRMASQWPVRTAVTIDNEIAYFAAGLFPTTGGVHLYALEAESGRQVWRQQIDLPPQGYILAAEGNLFVPNGRASPAAYSAANGAPLDPASDMRRQEGSSFVGLLDGMVVYGPSEFGIVRIRTAPEGDSANYNAARNRVIKGLFTGLEGRRLLYQDDVFYFLRNDNLRKLPREQFRKTLDMSALEFFGKRRVPVKSGVQLETDKQAEKEIAEYTSWNVPVSNARSLILAGDAVVVGAKDKVYAFNRLTGAKLLEAAVEGTAWELSADGGCIYASTDAGKIYCFGAAAEKRGTIKATAQNPFTDAPQEPYRKAAVHALEQADVKKGFCLILGAGEGRLAYELATRSDFMVLCVERDAAKVKQARDRLVQAGVYGSRVTVHHQPDGELPYIPYFANLMVADSAASGFKADAVSRLIQPYGGVLVAADGKVTKRGALEGGGDWTHMFADAANTSCSGDALIGGTNYQVQWFGNPGDFVEVGWHGNGMGPLSKDGRLYLIKVDSIETVDSYNGTLLWRRSIPGSARLNPGREGGSACVDSEFLYLAVKNDCQVFDVRTGEPVAQFFGPDKALDWGTIAVKDDLLFGTKQNAAATITAHGYRTTQGKSMWNSSEAEFVVSPKLFALDRKSGATRWEYGDAGRAIINSTITIDDGKIYFVESRNNKTTGDADGSLLLRDILGEKAFLVALNAETGLLLWEKPLDFKATTVLYLSAQDGKLILSGAYHTGPLADIAPTESASSALAGQLKVTQDDIKNTLINYIYRAVDAKDGQTLWTTAYTSDSSIGAQHNYNVSHPVITSEAVWGAPGEQYATRVDMKTGALKEYKNIQRQKGCATPTGSARAMFYRSMAIASFDFETEKQFYISTVNRPSCWMNILPAGGVVQMPEYSIGCNCAFPLQTSIVLVPEK
jgi:outer membrane protein assembly factor BamB